MPHTDTRSLQQIKRETEQTRAGLTDTVEQLKISVAETAGDIRRRKLAGTAGEVRAQVCAQSFGGSVPLPVGPDHIAIDDRLDPRAV